MPFALTFTGLLLIITGFQNTYKEFGAQVQDDFSGPNNFLYWLVSLLIIGMLGYVKSLEGLSRAFMGLIIVALILVTYQRNPQIFQQIGAGLAAGSTAPVNPIGAPLAGGTGGGEGGGGGMFDDIGSLAIDAGVSYFTGGFGF